MPSLNTFALVLGDKLEMKYSVSCVVVPLRSTLLSILIMDCIPIHFAVSISSKLLKTVHTLSSIRPRLFSLVVCLSTHFLSVQFFLTSSVDFSDYFSHQ